MASDWMFNNGIDDDSDVVSSRRMSRREAKECVEVYENHHYGGMAYTSEEYQTAKKVLGK